MADVPNTWPLNGYAPGNYWCRCLTCNDDFQGDKRAYQCLECAVSQIRGLLADLLSERERRTAQGVTAKWVGDEGNIPAGASVTILAIDNEDPDVPARRAAWVRYWPDGRDFPRYRSCDMCDLEVAAPSLSTSAGGGERG